MSRDSLYPFEGSMHRDTFTHPARTFKSIDVPNVLIRSYRSLVFRMRMDDARLHWLLTEFRLIVNKSIRIANESGIRSQTRLAQVAYRGLAQEHDVYKQYIPSAFEAALGALKAHRRRLRKGKRSSVPYIRRLFLKAENQSYWLDRATGRIKIPVRSGEHLEYSLSVAKWHQSFLKDEEWKLGSMTIVPGKVIVVVRKEAPRILEPTSVIALDTNEGSLDGVLSTAGGSQLVNASFERIPQIQLHHFRRRRRLDRKKRHDRRLARRLLAREGHRERNRVQQRMHRVSKIVVAVCKAKNAAIVLEALTLYGAGGRTRRMNRRLSSWPRREIHRQIEYKAALAGVPVIKVNPAWTSKTCPVCGARRRDRVGKVFVCLMCDWEMDRQINAGMNILKTALASNEALARAVRFQPGALRHDVVSPLYDLLREGEGAREEPSGAE